ncbi:MAG: hypothetical protein FWE67_08940 [Planctomycetaceae bacterium]|nr:hypothetical protein [Planctomycetaceae bacterium]
MRHILTFIFLFSLVPFVFAAETSLDKSSFEQVPNEVKPWCYYWWLKGNISKEQITHDLEAMQKNGFGGLLFFDSRGYHDDFDSKNHVPVPLQIKYEFMSPEWRTMVKHMIQEAARLGLQVSINIANTGGLLRGPWDMKDEGPKELCWASTGVAGQTKFTAELTIPADKRYYSEVALIAVKTKSEKGDLNDLSKKAEPFKTEKGKEPIVVSEVINLSDKVKNGKLEWDVPAGDWTLLRFGSEVVGDVGAVDILNAAACKKYFHLIGDELIKDAGDLAGKTLTHFYNVSWEGSAPDWTPGFPETFEKQNGYDILRYLPALAGYAVDFPEKTERFLSDYYRTVSHCFQKHCYAQIGQLCNERGIVWHSENGGPWPRQKPMFREADSLSFLGENDFPQGEFWVNESNLGNRSNMRYMAMAAHIYGKREVAVEAFTHMVRHWTMYPARLKPAADSNFIDGANKFIWHTFTASPPELGKPGFEYFAGTHINTNVTWWNEAKPFVTYLGRCQYLLQQGLFTADACVYVSDKNFTNWGRAEKWNPQSKLQLPAGYTYDLLDTEVLVNRTAVNNGKIVLPNGMSYKFLVLDPIENTLPAEALQKIVQLVKDGATVVVSNNKTVHSTGLKDHVQKDKEVAEAADILWDNNTGETVFPKTGPFKAGLVKKFGKGKIYTGFSSIVFFLDEEKILPDFEGPFEYHHRTLPDADIYFIIDTGKERQAECIFRVADKTPSIWNPLNGTITPAVFRKVDADRTAVAIDMETHGSLFVVFTKQENEGHIMAINAPEKGLEILPSPAGQFNYTVWKNGDYNMMTSTAKKIAVKAELPKPLELLGDWEVRFDPQWGGPEKTVFNKLILWNEHSDPAIKYYSGKATYVKNFVLNKEQLGNPMRLSVNAAHNVARVKVNGKELGILWTFPRTADVASAVKEGENLLEIEVVNCWANRLIGDAGLPKEKRFTKTNLYLVPERETEDWTYKAFQGFAANDPLLMSGLLGPVMIEFGKSGEIDLR